MHVWDAEFLLAHTETHIVTENAQAAAVNSCSADRKPPVLCFSTTEDFFLLVSALQLI